MCSILHSEAETFIVYYILYFNLNIVYSPLNKNKTQKSFTYHNCKIKIQFSFNLSE